jgi:putative salt-induced outer membrane protein YdiY
MREIKEFAKILGISVAMYLFIMVLAFPAIVFGETSGEFTAGYSHSMGNEDAMSGNVGLSLVDVEDNGVNQARIRMRYAEADGIQTAERYDGYVRGRHESNIIHSDYWFDGIEYALDEYGATREELLIYLGVGKYLVNAESDVWSVEAGPGYRIVDGDGDGHATFRAATKVDYSLGEREKLLAEATWITGSGPSVLNVEAELRVGIARAGIEVRDVAPTPEGAEGTDVRTTVGLVLTWGG